MSAITEAIFFLHKDRVIKEMMTSEFDALLDGIVQSSEFESKTLQAVYLQISDHLMIKSAIFFKIGFDAEGNVLSDWNIPFAQLLQSASRGPDLGEGVIRLVTQSQCSQPWIAPGLFDPDPSLYSVLTQAVRLNKLGIVESDKAWSESAIPTIPTLGSGTAEPPVLGAVPTLNPQADIPTAIPTAQPVAAESSSSEAQEPSKDDGMSSAEFAAMQQALTIKLNRLQKDYDALQDKYRTGIADVKQQAKDHVEQLLTESRQDLVKKDQQILSLKQQLEHEQKRYSELKEQQVEQVAQYQADRETMLDQLEEGQTVEAKKIASLKSAFENEIDARIEAETTKLNEQLAIREVELFYREEQMSIFEDEVKQLKEEKQLLLTDSGNQVLKQLEDNGVTFVVYHVGVGHITLALEDVGRYLNERNQYLAERCGISIEAFLAWHEHFNNPVCIHQDESGEVCGKPVPRVEWAASFEVGHSDCCQQHQKI